MGNNKMWSSTGIYSWPFAIIIIIYKWPVNSVEWLFFCAVCWRYKYVCLRKNTSEMCVKLNIDLQEICEWLRCNKLSLNILKTHYMILRQKKKTAQDLVIKISDTAVERVHDTKFLGVYIDAQLTWNRHLEYRCSKLSKCAGILLKARKKLNKSALVSLYYSFAYPYFIYCNQVWVSIYPTNLGRMVLLQKRLVRVVTCSHYRAHTEPLMLANQLLSINDINVYEVVFSCTIMWPRSYPKSSKIISNKTKMSMV